ncbi:MAG: hypothetical protein LBP56_05190 [Odoribacteraceae bacterium]|jgi:hypothetical protein|nr:hypothetical protein [Odoribacteraceae bacterium]
MIKIPFSPYRFASEAKSRVSGVNVTLEFANIESGLVKMASKLRDDTIGPLTYDTIVAYYDPDDDAPVPGVPGEALDYLQRAILHLALYNELIFLITRIGNDGITVKKNNDETTIFKYQQQELADALVETAWFWLGKLFSLLDANPALFPSWAASSQKQEVDSLPLSAADFNEWAGISNPYFVVTARWIIREVWMDSVEARFPGEIPSGMKRAVTRAVVYTVMEIACRRLAYAELPQPIRKDIDNEQSKYGKDKAEDTIRSSVAAAFGSKAERYWKDIDRLIDEAKPRPTRKTDAAPDVRDNDKFAFVL